MSCGDALKLNYLEIGMAVLIQNTGTSVIGYKLEKDTSLSAGAIVGISLGVLVAVGVVVFIVIRRKKLKANLHSYHGKGSLLNE